MKRERDEILEELVELFSASLAVRSTQELQGILDAMSTAMNVRMSHGHGLRAPNQAAVVVLNPQSSKQEVLHAIEQLREQLDQHWEAIRTRLQLDQSTSDHGDEATEKLLN
jgi:hypothetical protein